MDRQSMQYFEYVRARWTELPDIKPCDAEIPAEILESWRRCVNQGLEPCQANPAAELLLAWQHQLDPVNNTTAYFEYDDRVFLFALRDGATHAVVSIFALVDGKRHLLPMAEEHVGTNAVDLACRLKRGVFVNGPEHYTQSLHNCYAYAEPIFGAQRQMCCICCVYSDNANTTHEMSQFIHLLSSLGNGIYRLAHESRPLEPFSTSWLDSLPFGLVYVGILNTIKYFNRRIAEIFNFRKGIDTEVNLESQIISLCNTVPTGQRDVCTRYGNGKKRLNVTAVPLTTSFKCEKIYLIEDQVRVPAKVPADQQAKYTFDDIYTADSRMIQAKLKAATVAVHNIPVMLVGESGVGKEMFAQSIHNASPRRNSPFIAFNASAIAPNLVESTLFGYEKGAFTGASKEGKIGYFESASGGTLFLDELDSMPPDVQTKLLRAISSRSIRRVGGTEEIPVDVCLISAARVDVLELKQTFREDLYYRLSPVKIHIPRLADRQGDFLLLTRFFLQREADSLNIPCPEPTEAFIAQLKGYSWPGNVRELINILRQTLVFLEPGQLTLEADMLPEYLLQDIQNHSIRLKNVSVNDESTLKLAAIIAVCKSIQSGLYNVESIGQHLGLSTSTIYNYIAKGKQYGLL